MMPSTQKRGLIGVVLVLLVISIFLQKNIDPQRHQFEPKITNLNTAVRQLPVEFALGAATGLREAVAGLLWVRADEFFDNGDYEAVIPIVRIITWLDPHNTSVYETGAWHMDYNFTDADGRSDRRYIPLSLALMKEGIANNPDDSTMYADLAYTHLYRKVADYPEAVNWFEKGQELRNKFPDTWDVTAVGHGLAHALQACGRIDDAIAEWRLVVAEHARRVAKNKNDIIELQGYHSALRNMNATIMRKKWRATMTKPPIDPQFDATATRIAPMEFVFSGHAKMIGANKFTLETGQHTWGDIDGCRVEVRLQDADYKVKEDQPFTLNYSLAKGVTIMQEAISVQKDTFHRKVDMSQDHRGSNPMYSFAAPKYTLTFWLNPANENDVPPQVADRIGFVGEGLGGKYLDTSGIVPGTPGTPQPGLRMLKKTITLTRDDIMGTGVKDFH